MKTENYFLNCHSEESIAIRYKSLAKKHHPDVNKSPEATEVFKEIAKQREEALRAVLRKSGKSEIDINEYIKAVFSKDKEGIKKMTDGMIDEFLDGHGDKEPNFADVFKFVMNKFTGKPKTGLNDKSPSDKKKLE